jgi:amidase
VVKEREPWQLGAGELAGAIRERVVSSEDVVRAHLARIEEVNPRVNAVVELLSDTALAGARAADAAIARDDELGPLHGVPITIKVNVDVAGSPTTQGVIAFADARPPADAPLVAQLRKAGAIPIGRTNTPDFAVRLHTESGLHGATLNPWDPGRSPGGSSGGEAAALATGMTPLGIGNDYGGSLRVPSAACGTVALRPSAGRVPSAQHEPPDLPPTVQLYAVQGPMARRVDDVELALRSMCSGDPRDPSWVPAPLDDRPTRRPERIGVVVDPGGTGVDPVVADGVRAAAGALADGGFDVVELDPPLVEEGFDIWLRTAHTDVHVALFEALELLGSAELVRFHRDMRAAVPPLDLTGYVDALTRRSKVARAWSEFQDSTPFVVGPVMTVHAPAVGADLGGPGTALTFMRSARLTVLANLLGLPAVAVPAGLAEGVPLGVQVIGRRFEDLACLRVARAIEARLPLPTPIDPVT